MIGAIFSGITTAVKVGIGIAKLTLKVSKTVYKAGKNIYKGLKYSYQKSKQLRAKVNSSISTARKLSIVNLKEQKEHRLNLSSQFTGERQSQENHEFERSSIFDK